MEKGLLKTSLKATSNLKAAFINNPNSWNSFICKSFFLLHFNSINIFRPCLGMHERGGCAGMLRCGKATTWEGGMRVPAIASWPRKIPRGVSRDLITSIDLFPTLVSIANGSLAEEDNFAGLDQSKMLFGDQNGIRETFLYFPQNVDPAIGPYAIRHNNFKAHFYTEGSALSDDSNYDLACRSSSRRTEHDPPLLFDLDLDPGERFELQNKPEFAGVVEEMRRLFRLEADKVPWSESEIHRGQSRSAATCCNRDPNKCEPFPQCCDCHTKSFLSLKKNRWIKQ